MFPIRDKKYIRYRYINNGDYRLIVLVEIVI
nr:MAG TPA: hypothetical protein [Caudoviricetes sp.]